MGKCVGPLGIVSLHAKFAIWCLDDVTGERFHNLGRFQCGIRQRQSTVDPLRSGPGLLAKAEGEQFASQRAITTSAWGRGGLAFFIVLGRCGDGRRRRLNEKGRLHDRGGDIARNVTRDRDRGRGREGNFRAADDGRRAGTLVDPGLDLDIAAVEVVDGVGKGEDSEESDENKNESGGMHFHETTTRTREEGETEEKRTRNFNQPTQPYVQSAHATIGRPSRVSWHYRMVAPMYGTVSDIRYSTPIVVVEGGLATRLKDWSVSLPLPKQ